MDEEFAGSSAPEFGQEDGGDMFAEAGDGGDAFAGMEFQQEEPSADDAPAAELSPEFDGSGAGAAAAGGMAMASPLASVNARLREQAEGKDAEEREAKAQLRSKAEETIRSFMVEKEAALDKRKSMNRDAQEEAQQALDEALAGESWARVYSLVDVNAGADQEKEVDTSRMKDILIRLKTDGLPEAAATA